MVETLKQQGTWLSWRELKTGARWSVQCFRVEDDTLSGSAALRLFCFSKSHLTLRSSIMKGDERVVAPGGEAVTGQEWSSDGQTGHRSYSACWPAWGHGLGQQCSSSSLVRRVCLCQSGVWMFSLYFIMCLRVKSKWLSFFHFASTVSEQNQWAIKTDKSM